MPIQSMSMPRIRKISIITRMTPMGATSSPRIASATYLSPPERLKAPASTVAPNVTHRIVPTDLGGKF